MQDRRTPQQQFESACKHLESENIRVSRCRGAIGTVFLMQGFDKKRAQNLLKDIYFKYIEQEKSRNEVEYIQRENRRENTSRSTIQ